MNVKGIAYLAREAMMIAAHGEPKWKNFLADLAKQHPVFQQKPLPISKIPGAEFLALNDAITDRFYGGDPKAYWAYGEQSGGFALTQGQLKGLFQPGEISKFLMFTPMIWKGYFDAGELAVTQTSPTAIEVRIHDVPIKHVYFEYSVIGFAQGALKALKAAHPIPERIRGFSNGDPDILYRFRLD
jgi:hypothetical protein